MSAANNNKLSYAHENYTKLCKSLVQASAASKVLALLTHKLEPFFELIAHSANKVLGFIYYVIAYYNFLVFSYNYS